MGSSLPAAESLAQVLHKRWGPCTERQVGAASGGRALAEYEQCKKSQKRARERPARDHVVAGITCVFKKLSMLF